jgi:hypothetical protein
MLPLSCLFIWITLNHITRSFFSELDLLGLVRNGVWNWGLGWVVFNSRICEDTLS